MDTNISYWDEDGNTSREIEFSHLESQPLIEELKSRGWEAAGYIGGLLTYSQSDLENLPKKFDKYLPWITSALGPHTNIDATLSVTRPIARVIDSDLPISKILSESGYEAKYNIPNLMAIRDVKDNRQILIIDSLYEDDYIGIPPTDDDNHHNLSPSLLPDEDWEVFDKLYGFFHSQTIERIISGYS